MNRNYGTKFDDNILSNFGLAYSKQIFCSYYNAYTSRENILISLIYPQTQYKNNKNKKIICRFIACIYSSLDWSCNNNDHVIELTFKLGSIHHLLDMWLLIFGFCLFFRAYIKIEQFYDVLLRIQSTCVERLLQTFCH